MSNKDLCPCNSGDQYRQCCEPIINGDTIARTAEALMRSRYTAFVIKDVDYISKTWHPSTKPVGISPETIPEWYGLEIVNTKEGNDHDFKGIVEFKATSLTQKKIWHLHEVSHFVKEEEQWLYVNGDVKGQAPPPMKTKKIGRNEPCY